MKKNSPTSRERVWRNIAIVTSCLAVGTSASVGIVNHQATARSDANGCALKSFLTVVAERTKTSPRPGTEEITKKYNKLVAVLQPPLKDCDPKYVIK